MLLEDFKRFAFKGNVLDMAVGVIIGGAFGKIVSALVSDVIMPVISPMMPSGDWRTAGITLLEGGPPGPEGDARILLGDFGGVVIDFLIVAFVLFLVVRMITRAMPKKEAPQNTRECPACLEQIPKAATRCRSCTSPVEPVAA